MSGLFLRFRKIAEHPDTPLGPHEERALHLAAQEGDIETAQEALAAGAHAHIPDRMRNTPLIYAALRGDVEMAALLLRGGKRYIDHAGNSGTALGIAAAMGDIALARLLLEFGAYIDARDDGSTTPLMRAVQAGEKEVAAFLLENGADAAAARKDGVTALHLAVEGAANAEMLPLLLKHGGAAAIDCQSKRDGLTLLHQATLLGDVKMARLLLQTGATTYPRRMGKTALDLAAEGGNIPMIRLLVEEGHADLNKTEDEYPPLHNAILALQRGAARELVRLGADPCLAAKDGRGALERAAWKGDLELVRCFAEELPEGDPGGAARMRAQALYEALFYGHADVARYLMASGRIDFNRPVAGGETLLNTALRHAGDEIVAALLGAGADPSLADGKGFAPLGLAAERQNSRAVGLLIARGARAPATEKHPEASKTGLKPRESGPVRSFHKSS